MGGAFQTGGVSLVIRAPNDKGSLSATQSQFPHFPGHIIGLKARFPTSLAVVTISDCQQPSSEDVLASEVHSQPFWVFTLVPFVWLFIFKCQWSSPSLSTGNSGRSAPIPPHTAGAGRLGTSFARILCHHDCSRLDSNDEPATQDLRSGRKPANIVPLAPVGRHVEFGSSKVCSDFLRSPANAVIVSSSLLQLLRFLVHQTLVANPSTSDNIPWPSSSSSSTVLKASEWNLFFSEGCKNSSV